MELDWRVIDIPEFGIPDVVPEIPVEVYERRCENAYLHAGCDWLIVYGDREHYANIAYLSGFDPRFEEAIFVIGPKDRRVLVVGNEGLDYTNISGLKFEVALCQSLSLMGQDRSKKPKLIDILGEIGLKRGQSAGLVGWKYLESEETNTELPGFFVPFVLVDTLRTLLGSFDAIMEKTPILMHPAQGLRTINEVEQIALLEWASSRATLAVSQIIQGIFPGMSEHEAVANMRYAGEPLSAHVMFASGHDKIIGLRSPSGRLIEQGDAATTAIGYWGGLGCRAGLVDTENEEFLEKIAKPYFAGVVKWYETMHIGVQGNVIHSEVNSALSKGGLYSTLNSGHLTSLDEWLHTPVRSGSKEKIVSGMAFQCDIIPAPMPLGRAINCEDPVVIADEALRQLLNQRFPDIWVRIHARQEFMRMELGIAIRNEILPLSSIPACLPPLWLNPKKVLSVKLS